MSSHIYNAYLCDISITSEAYLKLVNSEELGCPFCGQ